MMRQRCEHWACKWKRCENVFIFTLNGLIFTSDINNFSPSVLGAEVSICALLIGEIECHRSPCSHANLPYLLPTLRNWDSRICPSDSCLSSCFQGVQTDEMYQQSKGRRSAFASSHVIIWVRIKRFYFIFFYFVPSDPRLRPEIAHTIAVREGKQQQK